MRKLKLQMQTTVDGFVAGPNGELDWMQWNWDDQLKKHVSELTGSMDCILLGRKMTDGFISHWSSVAANPDNSEFVFGKIMYNTLKVVFTKTLDRSVWENTILAKGDIVEEVKKLKNKNGQDIIVYGGAGFVSSLVSKGLIDEYNLFVNPAAIGKGMTIFNTIKQKQDLKLVNSHSFLSGITWLQYEPKRNFQET